MSRFVPNGPRFIEQNLTPHGNASRITHGLTMWDGQKGFLIESARIKTNQTRKWTDTSSFDVRGYGVTNLRSLGKPSQHAFLWNGAFVPKQPLLNAFANKKLQTFGGRVAFAKKYCGAYAIWLCMPSSVHKTVRLAFAGH